MDNRTKISVLMPVYNGARYLPAAIESILDQTYRDFEFIIIDDHSTDDSARILACYRAQDARIQVHRNGQNLGIAHTLNRALDLAKGEYIARMDSDDISLPQRFERQVEFLDAHPEVGVVGTQTRTIDDDGHLAPQHYWEQSTSPACLVWHLLYATPLCHPSTMMRPACLRAVKGYDPAYANEDMHLWTKLAFVTRMVNLDEVLVYYRMSAQKQEEKSLYWESHIKRVGHEYAERILNRAVDPQLIQLFFNFRKYGRIDQGATFFDVFALCSLLKELFAAMKRDNLIDPQRTKEVEDLLLSHTQHLVVTAFQTITYE